MEKELLLLHLSDLHFGASSRFDGEAPKSLGERLAQTVREARGSLCSAEDVALIIVTGDLTQAAMPREYKRAQEFLVASAAGLRVPHRRLVVLPGNHDVSWTECRRAEEEADHPPDQLRRRLDDVKFNNYRAFLSAIWPDEEERADSPLGRGAFLYRYPELRLAVLALNSCERESHRREDHAGEVSEAQAQAGLAALKDSDLHGWFKIVAFHHHPEPVHMDLDRTSWLDRVRTAGLDENQFELYWTDLAGLVGKERVQALVRDACPQLVLHGHKHASQERMWQWQDRGFAHLLSAGSMGANPVHLPKDEPNSVRLICLDPRKQEIRARTLIYEPRARVAGKVQPGAFVPDPAEASHGYIQTLSLPPGYHAAQSPGSRFRGSGDDLREALATQSPHVIWLLAPEPHAAVYAAVSALANDLTGQGRDGLLLIGISPEGVAMPVGTEDDAVSRTTEDIRDRLRGHLLPSPHLHVEAVLAQGARMILVRVSPSRNWPPVAIDSQVFVRDDAARVRTASESDLARMQERLSLAHLPFDQRPCEGATLSDLDLALLQARHAAAKASDADEPNFPSFEDWLIAREQLARVRTGVLTPNNAAILLYGKSPQDFHPGAVVEFVRYGGVDVDADVISRRTITGTLGEQLDTAWAQLRANLTEEPQPGDGMRAPYAPAYPFECLKELSRNLVQHRLYDGTRAPGRIEWYEDRIVFSNPGGPYGGAKEGPFGAHSDYRNPTITAGLRLLGHVEQLGRGVRKARKSLHDNGNPDMEEQIDGHTTLVIRRRP